MDVPIVGRPVARRDARSPAMLRSREAAFVAAVLLLATLARLPALFGDGLWRDEANVYVQLAAPTFGEFFARVTAAEWHPPLFFLLMYGWVKLAGADELALKILPFLFGIATVGLVYLIGKTVASRTAGTAAAVAYGVAPFTVTYSSEYLYPLAGFTCTLLTLLVLRARERPLTAPAWAGLASAALAAIFTHYTALIDVPLLAGWVLVSRVALRRRLGIATALTAGMLPFALWLPTFMHQRRIGVPYSPPGSLRNSLDFLRHALPALIPARPHAFEAALVIAGIGALVVLARARSLDRTALAAAAVFFIALGVNAAANITQPRYVLPMYDLVCVAFGCTVARLGSLLAASDPAGWRRCGRALALGAGIVLIGADLVNAAAISRTPKSGMRALLRAPLGAGSTLYLLAPDYLASTFAYYARENGAPFAGFVRWDRPDVFRLEDYAADWHRPDAVDQTITNIAAAPTRYTQLALVVDDSARDSAQCPYGRVQTLLARLRARYPLISSARFPGRYEPVTEYRFRRTQL